jgi:putative transposase
VAAPVTGKLSEFVRFIRPVLPYTDRMNYQARFLPGRLYHIYTRTEDAGGAFRSERDYDYFVRLLRRRVTPAADVLAYALLPDHLHLLLRTHEDGRPPAGVVSGLLSVYTRMFNSAHQRRGRLFGGRYSRTEIDPRYLGTVAAYVHLNPIWHGHAAGFDQWAWSSIHAYLDPSPSWLQREVLWAALDGPDGLREFHEIALTLYRGRPDSGPSQLHEWLEAYAYNAAPWRFKPVTSSAPRSRPARHSRLPAGIATAAATPGPVTTGFIPSVRS